MNLTDRYRPGLEIAVIGMAARLPGARTLDEFLHNLLSGTESIERLTTEELKALHVDSRLIEHEQYIKVRASMKDVDRFDAAFFGYTDEEARLMDPQMRILHECVWEVLENAGYNPEQYKGTLGLFAGGTPNPLWEAQTLLAGDNGIWGEYERGNSSSAYAKTLLHDKDLMSTRVAYKLNLRGPAITLFTSCSTSLVSVHYAAQSILAGECDIAIAGGVSVIYPKRSGYFYQEGMIVAPDGRCRSYDADASGTVFGDGIGLVALKRLEDAIADGDHIHAILKGSAVNNDGSNRIGYTAPGIDGQASVIKQALQVAEVEAESIRYIEGHGSATKVGDSIEIEAMKQAFQQVNRPYSIAIGSVKSNIGHLNSASGAAGLIKTILSLKHRKLFPTLHFEEPNFQLIDSPFYVNTEIQTLDSAAGHPLRAGVSAFGAGGTNAHIVLEEPPTEEALSEMSKSLGSQMHDAVDKHIAERIPKLITLSARTESALRKQALNLLEHLQANSGLNIADVAYTLNTGRKSFPLRKMFVCSDTSDAIRILQDDLSGKEPLSVHGAMPKHRNIVFMFSGQGAQYTNMGIDLYRTNNEFKQIIDYGCELFRSLKGYDLKGILYPAQDDEAAKQKFNETAHIQPILFLFEYALAKMIMGLGIEPSMLIGYSLGELTAACIAEVISFEDAVRLFVLRGELMSRTEAGQMLSIPMDRESLRPYLHDQLSLAIDNGLSCIVSGSKLEVDALHAQMAERRILCMPINHMQAAHSHFMEPILKPLASLLETISLSPPKFPIVSNVTGRILEHDEATNPAYWVRQLRETVRFAQGIKQSVNPEQEHLFIELGPGRDLSLLVHSLLGQGIKEKSKVLIVDLIRTANSPISELVFTYNRIGRLWANNIRMSWNSFYYGQSHRRVPLPAYPFEGETYWLNEQAGYATSAAAAPLESGAEVHKKARLDDWFYVPSWKCMPILQPGGLKEGSCFLLFSNSTLAFEHKLMERLRMANCRVIQVEPCHAYAKAGDDLYEIRAESGDDYIRLLSDLQADGIVPDGIIHAWALTTATVQLGQDHKETFATAQQLGLYSLLHIIKSIHKSLIDSPVEISVLTSDIHDVIGDEQTLPAHSTLLSTVKIISQENMNINCRAIDLPAQILTTQPESASLDRLVELLVDELAAKCHDRIVAYRGKQRWLQSFEPLLIQPAEDQPWIRQQGVYLITGGLGDVGYALAKHLASKYHAKIALVNRTPLPERSDWEACLAQDGAHGEATKIKRILLLESFGQPVEYYAADIADMERVAQIVCQIESSLGPINGVIHAAGAVGKGGVASYEIDAGECEEHFRGKVYGLWALEHALSGKALDFCLITSSLSNILGGLGDTAYAAANNYVDHFVSMQRREGLNHWKSVNWETWLFEKEEGDRHSPSGAKSSLGIHRLAYAMGVDEGIETFERMASMPKLGRIVVSSGNLQARIDTWVKPDLNHTEIEGQAKADTIRSRPDLLTAYQQPRTASEELLVSMWQQSFGIDPIGVKDDFFELGGNSLSAISMIGKIYKETGVQVSLTEFFAHPTIEAVARALETAPDRMDVDARADNVVSNTVIKPTACKEAYRVSAAQKRIYIVDQMEGSSTAYNEPVVVELEGNVDKFRLQQAFDALLERHESLRTSFEARNGEIVQIVHDKVSCALTSCKATAETVDDCIASFIQPFDLSQAPLMRVELLELSPTRYLLIMDIHHIITDGVSETLIAQQLLQLYSGHSLPVPLIQYKDYCEWQHEMKARGELRRQELFWLDVYEHASEPLRLPQDYTRPPVQSFEGRTYRFRLDKSMCAGIIQLSKTENATVFMTMLTVFAVWLHKLGRNEDVVVGTATSGRQYEELQQVVGMFVNTLPLRIYPTCSKRFTELLTEVRQHVIAAFEHQDYPFEDLIESLDVPRDSSRNPLFDVMFVWQNMNKPEITLSDVRLKQLPTDKGTAKLDLSFTGFELDDGTFEIEIEYATKLFKEDTIERFARYYCEIIRQIAIKPDMRLNEISVVDEEERAIQLQRFNRTKVEYPLHKRLVSLLEEQAVERPEQIAIICEHGTMTYRELNEKANQFADLIIKLGIRRNMIVGIVMQHSLEMVVGIWGILKAGAAYLPIAPESPLERKKMMLRDCNVPYTVTSSNFMDQLSELDCKLIALDDGSWDAYSTSNPDVAYDPDQPAYVIYTSGSTGTPKGTLISCQGLLNVLMWNRDQFNLTAKDVILQKTTFTFDASIEELFMGFTVGAKTVIAKPGGEKEPDYLLELIRREAVTVIEFVPSALAAFLRSCPEQRIDCSLRLCMLGGEAATLKLVEAFYDKFGDEVELYNVYGPTETTISACYHRISKHDVEVLIGRPLSNMRVYILDDHRDLLPIGVVGEIYIAGVQVGKGYLNQPHLTQRMFVEDPFVPGCRMYKTGDLGKWTPDGYLHCIGRNDNQVKVRGYRIELGEIEQALLRHPDISEAAAVVRQDAADAASRGIEAFIKSERAMTQEEVKRFLMRMLPDYMIPSRCYEVIEFPTTASGKLDRKSLSGHLLDSEVAFAEPQTELEQKMVHLWQSILSVQQVGVDDNFFDLGGNSLNIIVLHNELKALLEIDIPVHALFRFPTIRSLAMHVQEQADGLEDGFTERKQHLLERADEGKKRLMARRSRVR